MKCYRNLGPQVGSLLNLEVLMYRFTYKRPRTSHPLAEDPNLHSLQNVRVFIWGFPELGAPLQNSLSFLGFPVFLETTVIFQSLTLIVRLRPMNPCQANWVSAGRPGGFCQARGGEFLAQSFFLSFKICSFHLSKYHVISFSIIIVTMIHTVIIIHLDS